MNFRRDTPKRWAYAKVGSVIKRVDVEEMGDQLYDPAAGGPPKIAPRRQEREHAKAQYVRGVDSKETPDYEVNAWILPGTDLAQVDTEAADHKKHRDPGPA